MSDAQRQAMGEAFTASRSIQNYWLALSADPKFEDAKLTALRPAFQKAWDARDKFMGSLRNQGDITSASTTMKTASDELDKELKKVLTDEQMTKLKETAAAMGGTRGFGAPGGGAPGAGAPGGAPGVGTRSIGGGATGGTGGTGTHGTHSRGTDTGTGGKSATGAPAAGF